MTLAEQLKASMDIYYRRVKGETGIWSASTRCIKCEDWWMWGIEDNMVFTCPKCKLAETEMEKLEEMKLDNV